ncbi:hypothetical protein HaLaN_02296 [Haematococcus lacustris]|uniref:Uncharacterized protein n=1 Tax=Haematococcus lacustris TaxID=44745 RepID=A0A699YN19_HAELA|nr:hypothetical protein HaLaN_02296 [Haematococcus lacustris]
MQPPCALATCLTCAVQVMRVRRRDVYACGAARAARLSALSKCDAPGVNSARLSQSHSGKLVTVFFRIAA